MPSKYSKSRRKSTHVGEIDEKFQIIRQNYEQKRMEKSTVSRSIKKNAAHESKERNKKSIRLPKIAISAIIINKMKQSEEKKHI